MGNKTTKDIGNFQEGVGKVGGQMGVITGTIFGSILIILGVGFIITSFIPFYNYYSSNLDCSSNNDCKLDNEDCINNKCTLKNRTKTRHYWLSIIGFILIIFAILLIWGSRYWNNLVKHNRTAAQVGGTMMEAGLFENLFHK